MIIISTNNARARRGQYRQCRSPRAVHPSNQQLTRLLHTPNSSTLSLYFDSHSLYPSHAPCLLGHVARGEHDPRHVQAVAQPVLLHRHPAGRAGPGLSRGGGVILERVDYADLMKRRRDICVSKPVEEPATVSLWVVEVVCRPGTGAWCWTRRAHGGRPAWLGTGGTAAATALQSTAWDTVGGSLVSAGRPVVTGTLHQGPGFSGGKCDMSPRPCTSGEVCFA